MKTHIPLLCVLYIAVCLAFSGCGGKPATGYQVPVEKRGCIPLTFSPTKPNQQVGPLQQNQIKKVVKEVRMDNARVFVYAHTGDTENLYGGYESNQGIYDLGKIGIIVPDSRIITINTLKLFGKTMLRIKGALAIDYPQNSYFVLENGIPAPLLRIEGHVEEMDIDNNGLKELVASSQTISTAEIYRWWEGHLEVVSINDATGAAEVFPNEKDPSLFEVYYRSNLNRPGLFKYNGDTLTEMKK